MEAERVPVKVQGKIIGSAHVSEDGGIELSLNTPSDFGKELLDGIAVGMIAGLNLSPVVIPVVPSVRSLLRTPRILDRMIEPHNID